MASFEIERIILPAGETDPYIPTFDGTAVPAPRPRPQVLPKLHTAPRPRVRRKLRLPMLAVQAVSICVMAVMVVSLIMSNIRLTEVATEAAKYKKELTLLQEREKKLQSQYNTTLDLKSIEATATNDYAMTPPTSSQIVYLNLSREDKAQVLTGIGEGIFSGIRQFFLSVSAYLTGTGS